MAPMSNLVANMILGELISMTWSLALKRKKRTL
jgi:hypothetical protein